MSNELVGVLTCQHVNAHWLSVVCFHCIVLNILNRVRPVEQVNWQQWKKVFPQFVCVRPLNLLPEIVVLKCSSVWLALHLCIKNLNEKRTESYRMKPAGVNFKLWPDSVLTALFLTHSLIFSQKQRKGEKFLVFFLLYCALWALAPNGKHAKIKMSYYSYYK